MPPGLSMAVLLTAATVLASTEARADFQGTADLTIGVAGKGLDRAIWSTTVFHLGLRGDVMFGRSSWDDFGIGPYLEVFTHAFDEIQFGGGVSTLLPVVDVFPVVVSVGAYGRKGGDPFGLEPGLSWALFWGSRSYNFHANYVMTAGFLAQMRYGLGDSKETAIILSAQLDLVGLALPILYLINAVRGGSPDTDSIR